MSSMQTNLNAQQMSIQAVVVRCTCGDPGSHIDEPCPRGRTQNLGTICYWHRNPLLRLLFAVRKRVAPGLTFWAK